MEGRRQLFAVNHLQRFDAVALPVRIFALFSSFALVVIASRLTTGFTDGPILCLFRNATGLPCPFCGTTRSVGSLAQGDFIGAASLNPLGFAVLIFAVAVFFVPGQLADLNERIARMWWRISAARQAVLTISLLAGLWLLNLPRMI